MPRKVVKKSPPQTAEKVSSDLPKEVRIGYRDIEIEYVSPDFKTDNLTDCYGEYRAREGKILVQHNLCGQEMANVVLHECLHAIAYSAGLNQANGPLKEDDGEELVVNQTTNYLIAMFRDNPWFLDFLKNNIHKSKDSV
jgi:hypothetical protein|tara:strand:- start:351 stop:767 length:417 start_codon:yes stop_codon:yes gene_type:complete